MFSYDTIFLWAPNAWIWLASGSKVTLEELPELIAAYKPKLATPEGAYRWFNTLGPDQFNFPRVIAAALLGDGKFALTELERLEEELFTQEFYDSDVLEFRKYFRQVKPMLNDPEKVRAWLDGEIKEINEFGWG